MTVHPIAELFPILQGKDFDQLCESIQTVGLLDPLVRDGDELLDGRNRLRAESAWDIFLETLSKWCNQPR